VQNQDLKIVGMGEGSWGHIKENHFKCVFNGKIILKKNSSSSAAPEEFNFT
jgi:hypothetical protein